ncbi:hypothetical protein JAAARDRAFT_148049 [Jaapia argillacea MUCL 33604]|uniref:Uncharacterized protein n=1 Tax=Jaapia argillacea MUCL 33604 TaxID=933084 RepID=A0A067Q950_9AGAM|nr:hypothetical protein JAAARDRAFT_148049 [Jaapia argillacea MUCL 33604]
MLQEVEAPPPEFAPYEAEHSVLGDGSIVSRDPHLNEDGEALYRFLLSHASTPPKYIVHCKGTHEEERRKQVKKKNEKGEEETKEEVTKETVIDFDFRIDIGQHIVAGPIHWSVADHEPAYRGDMFEEVDGRLGRREASGQELKNAHDWKERRSARGLPPWQDASSVHDPDGHTATLRSSRTIREWADDYCSSTKSFKEFVYEKVCYSQARNYHLHTKLIFFSQAIYGWNFEGIEAAIRSIILATHYTGKLSVDYELTSSKICVRSGGFWTETLLMPFVWLYKKFHPQGGGRWEVCGGAYALKYWQHCSQTDIDGDAMPSHIITAPDGVQYKLLGMREGEWFRLFEGTIRRSVIMKRKSDKVIIDPDDQVPRSVLALDGYPAGRRIP